MDLQAAAPQVPPKPVSDPGQIEAIRYINRLATLSSTPILGWDLNQIFGSGQGKELIVDRGEINRIFFETKKTKPVATNEALQKFEPLLKQLSTHERTKQLDNARLSYEEALSEVRRRYAAAETYLGRAREHASKIKMIESAPQDEGHFAQEVKEIEAKGFWSLWNVKEHYIEFVNLNDLVLSQVNDKAKINIQVNFGRFRVRILLSGETFCYPHFNNVGAKDKSHPHIFADGRICWGTAGEVAAEAVAKLEISKHLDLLAHILTNHNPDDPVYRIDTFGERRWNLVEPIPPWKKPGPIPEDDELHCEDTCADCDKPIDDCDCEATF